MTRLRPLARLTYATAFFGPFFWAATSHADTLNADMDMNETVIEIRTAADIIALADLDGDPTVISPEEVEMIAMLHQVFSVPVQTEISALTHQTGLIPQASGGL